IDARIRLAHTLLLLDRAEEAFANCDQVLGLGLNSHLALHDLGNVLWKLQRPDRALECYDGALAICPDYVPALINRGNVLIELRRFEEALAGYARVQELQPDNAEANFAESMLRLRLGEFRLGLEKQEWRGRLPDKPSPHRRFQKPLWLGDPDLNGKTILIH